MTKSTGEFELLRKLAPILEPTLMPGMLGVGDDAAVIPLDGMHESLLLATDSSVEGVHFSLEHLTPFEVGWKSLVVTISDIAAMGGSPRAALLSLHLPPRVVCSLEEVYQGVAACAAEYNCAVVGGDTVVGKEFALVSTVLGSCKGPGLRRSGASRGEDVWVTGTLGAAALGLRSFSNSFDRSLLSEEELARCRTALRRPQARVETMLAVVEHAAISAAQDVSDGLLQDLGHIAAASSVRILVEQDAVPTIGPQALAVRSAFVGGDDYEIVFCADKNHREILGNLSLPVQISRIGCTIEGEPGVVIQPSTGAILEASQFAKEIGGDHGGYTHRVIP